MDRRFLLLHLRQAPGMPQVNLHKRKAHPPPRSPPRARQSSVRKSARSRILTKPPQSPRRAMVVKPLPLLVTATKTSSLSPLPLPKSKAVNKTQPPLKAKTTSSQTPPVFYRVGNKKAEVTLTKLLAVKHAPSMIFVQGPTGVGKTALINHVVERTNRHLVPICNISIAHNPAGSTVPTIKLIRLLLTRRLPCVILMDNIEGFDAPEYDSGDASKAPFLVNLLKMITVLDGQMTNPIIFTCVDKSSAHIRKLASLSRIVYMNAPSAYGVAKWLVQCSNGRVSFPLANTISSNINGDLRQGKIQLAELIRTRATLNSSKTHSEAVWTNINRGLEIMESFAHSRGANATSTQRLSSSDEHELRAEFSMLYAKQDKMFVNGTWGCNTSTNLTLDQLAEKSDMFSVYDICSPRNGLGTPEIFNLLL